MGKQPKKEDDESIMRRIAEEELELSSELKKTRQRRLECENEIALLQARISILTARRQKKQLHHGGENT